MKSILFAIAGIVIGGASVTPSLALVQERSSVSRAAVAAQMRQLADVGYRATGDETVYPEDVEAAEQRAGLGPARQARVGDTSGYGRALGPRSESGAREPKGPGSLYFGM